MKKDRASEGLYELVNKRRRQHLVTPAPLSGVDGHHSPRPQCEWLPLEAGSPEAGRKWPSLWSTGDALDWSEVQKREGGKPGGTTRPAKQRCEAVGIWYKAKTSPKWDLGGDWRNSWPAQNFDRLDPLLNLLWILNCPLASSQISPNRMYFGHQSQPYHGEGACVTQWSYEPCCTGPPIDRQVIMKSSDKQRSMEEEMTKHPSILALKTPWTIWKAKRYDTRT